MVVAKVSREARGQGQPQDRLNWDVYGFESEREALMHMSTLVIGDRTLLRVYYERERTKIHKRAYIRSEGGLRHYTALLPFLAATSVRAASRKPAPTVIVVYARQGRRMRHTKPRKARRRSLHR